MSSKIIDKGDICLECHKSTAFGSGRFVNRIPAGTDEEEGYMCEACQTSDECFDCSKAPVFGDVRCEEHGETFEREMEVNVNVLSDLFKTMEEIYSF